MDRFSRKSRGATLVELIIGVGLMALILTLCSALFVSSWRRFHETNVMSDLHNSAVIGLDRFGRDLRETAASSMIYDNDGKYWILAEARNNGGTYMRDTGSQAQWQYWACYYLFEDRSLSPADGGEKIYLLAKKKALFDATSATGPAPASFTSDISGAVIVAKNVKAFSMSGRKNSQDLYTCRLSIETLRYYQGRKYNFLLDKAFTLPELTLSAPSPSPSPGPGGKD
ncbi:MAG: hypothetical protein RDV48_18885 [Candidatus Eremiobacteraeota bacterium]|nr:hypothetical protein [Candidatus Eremiobacteraeota bacterium]